MPDCRKLWASNAKFDIGLQIWNKTDSQESIKNQELTRLSSTVEWLCISKIYPKFSRFVKLLRRAFVRRKSRYNYSSVHSRFPSSPRPRVSVLALYLILTNIKSAYEVIYEFLIVVTAGTLVDDRVVSTPSELF